MQQNQLTKGEGIWLGIVFAAVVFSAAEAPFTFTFDTKIQFWQVIADGIISALFIADFIYSIRKYKKQSELPPTQRISARQFKIYSFIDIVAIIPFDLIFYMLGYMLGPIGMVSAKTIKLLRMIRLVRIVKIFQVFNSMPLISGWLKISLAFVSSMIVVHWFSCFWIMFHPLPANMDRTSYYIECFYWTVTTLTTVGYGDITPKTNAGRIYTMFVMFIGVGVYGFVIGNISRIFAESARYKEQGREKFAELNAFMKYYHIPSKLQSAVFNYYGHLYNKRLSDNDTQIISELPHALKQELQVFMNMKLIRNLPVFQFCSIACLREVSGALEQKFYSPGDTIINIGEIGDEMFIIGHGIVDVITDDGKTVAQLHEGQFFGEAALIQETTRNANIRASAYTDLYRLSKDDFIQIIRHYPELLDSIKSVTHRRASDRNGAMQKKLA
ncbi:MAG: hypothetical protein CME63_07845 [Halobacteriovoraceae bacterium]|nr:hypothetical protein [Halobacteriovoraceae bacterium]|tara:strand:+ start:5876 stop:7201 length:1326 start_codon:yes stop_codon:yes gene_type:complete